LDKAGTVYLVYKRDWEKATPFISYSPPPCWDCAESKVSQS
jgi:hypothetical protein